MGNQELELLVKSYQSGNSLTVLARKAGLSRETLAKKFRAAGVKLRSLSEATRRRHQTKRIQVLPDLLSLINWYNEGASIAEISREVGICRTVITRAFTEASVKLRSQSESEHVKWRRAKAESGDYALYKERQCGAAWQASLGRRDSPEKRARMAKARYSNQSHIHKGETEIAEALRLIGIPVEQQWPEGPYNIDVAILDSKIAVEVIGSNWKPHMGPKIANRTKYLLDKGWLVLFILTWRRDVGLLRPRNPDNTFAKTVRTRPVLNLNTLSSVLRKLDRRIRTGEPLSGQFGMISGNGEPLINRCGYLDHFPRIVGL